MGQRLNIEIKENDKVLANSYYHWSGYTSSSLQLAQIILDNINQVNFEDRIVNAIKLLETTGAGLTEREIEYAKTYIKDFNNYTFEECSGRNDGLISIGVDGIKETEYWEEARVEINLDTKIIDFKAVWEYTKDKYIGECQEYNNVKYEDVPVYDINLHNISFNNFSKIAETILNLIDQRIYDIRLKNDEKVYGFIE
jgi:hypothetical protein